MISVVIPAFNAEATIERAVDSVLGQEGVDLEVIVVDDGSTDGTVEIIEFLARRDSRVSVLRNTHTGPGAARNMGIDAATGEWLAFLDADDEYAPEAFATILKRVNGRDVGLVIFSIELVRAYIYSWPPSIAVLTDGFFAGNGDRADSFMREYKKKKRMLVYSQSNKLYRRSIVEANGLRFDDLALYGEDQLFNYAYLRHAGSVITMSSQLLRYHLGLPGTLSDRFPSGGAAALVALSEAKLDLFRDYGYTDAQLEGLRRHDARNILEETLRGLIRRDQGGGSRAVRKSFRDMKAATIDRRLLARHAAVTRRTRVMQLVLRARSAVVAATVIRELRRREDRRILDTRRGEIDREFELRRLALTEASERERARYYFLSDYEYFLDRINGEGYRNLVRDKAIALRRLADAPAVDLLGREWLDLRRSPFAEFAAFTEGRERFVAKIFDGASGNGVEVIETPPTVQQVADLHERLLQQKKYVVEGYLTQHPQLARFYGGAVATLRIHTLNLGGDVQVVLPTTVSFGSRGGVTSNAWSIQAFFDIDSGLITTDGIYQGPAGRGVRPDTILVRHPDSGEAFRGAGIPFTAEVRRCVAEAARLIPELPFIGWDVACTPTGPIIIEGNAAPLIQYSWQNMTRLLLGARGMRADFESVLERFERHQSRRSAEGSAT